MTPATTGWLHVLGVAAPGDPTTATARALRDVLAAEGLPGRVAALDVHGACGVTPLDPDELGDHRVLLHAVDGGESLAPVLDRLRQTRSVLVHHGSRPGSDRNVLRSLRDAVDVAAGTGPASREELRRLGFGEPVALPARGLAEGDEAARTDRAGADQHPGPHLLAVGPIAEGRFLELLVDSFASLLHGGAPSAVLSICGPGSAWYVDALLARVLRRGLVACEVIQPDDEDAVRARLQRCDVYVALRPGDHDPYLRLAADHAAVVGPRRAATAAVAGPGRFFAVEGTPTRDGVLQALRQAVAASPVGAAAPTAPSATATALSDLLRIA